MTFRLARITVLLVWLIPVASACGAQETTSHPTVGPGATNQDGPSLSAWQRAATDVCDEYRPQLELVEEEHGQPADMESAALLLTDVVDLSDDYVAAFVAVGMPDDRADDVSLLHEDLAEMSELARDLLAAAENEDANAAEDASTQLLIVTNRVNRRAAALGIPACDARTGASNPAIAGCAIEDFGALVGETAPEPQQVADSVVDERDDISSVVSLGEHESQGRPAFLFQALDASGSQVGVLQVALAPIGEYSGFLFPCVADGGEETDVDLDPKPVDPRRGVPEVAPSELPLEFGWTSGDVLGMPGTTAGALVTNPSDDQGAYFVEVRFDLIGTDGTILDRVVVVAEYIAPGETRPVATTSFGIRIGDIEPDHVEVSARGQLLADEGRITDDATLPVVELEMTEARIDLVRTSSKLVAEVANDSGSDVDGFYWTCVFLEGDTIVGGHSQVGAPVRDGESIPFDWTIPANITSDDSVCVVEGFGRADQ